MTIYYFGYAVGKTIEAARGAALGNSQPGAVSLRAEGPLLLVGRIPSEPLLQCRTRWAVASLIEIAAHWGGGGRRLVAAVQQVLAVVGRCLTDARQREGARRVSRVLYGHGRRLRHNAVGQFHISDAALLVVVGRHHIGLQS